MKRLPSVKLLIGYHKPSLLFKSDVLTPIHLGRTIATRNSKDGHISTGDLQWLMDNMIGDDTGINISHKNRLHAESTALYWAWHNYERLGNPDYIGLMHYRRLLNFSGEQADETYAGLQDEIIRKCCSRCDVVLSKLLPAWSNKKKKNIPVIYEQYSLQHYEKDLRLFIEIIRRDYPEMIPAMEKVLYHSQTISWYGIFVMKRELFFEYAKITFSIHNQLEKLVKWQDYPIDQQRFCGYLQEFLLNIFCIYKNSQKPLKIEHLPLYRVKESDQKKTQLGIDIHICFGTDNKYIRHTATAIASVLKNANALDKYHFHILSQKLSWFNRQKLKQLKKIRAFSVDFPEIDSDELQAYGATRLPDYINLSTYLRLFIPKVLPNIDKVIYLDSDLIALKDINSMMATDMQNHWFAGVEDINAVNLAKHVGLPDSRYINAGVLLINNKSCRENNYYQIMLHRIQKNIQRYALGDQDILNDAFHDKIKLISYRYNMFFKSHNRLKNFKPSDSEDFKESCEHPVIVHFVGPVKPWLPDNQHQHRKEYEYYLSLTPWSNKRLPEKIKSIAYSLKTTVKSENHITKKIFGIPYYKKIFNGNRITTYRFPGAKLFHLYKKIRTPQYKQIKLSGIPLKTTIKGENHITKKTFGIPYYKKIFNGNRITTYRLPGAKLFHIYKKIRKPGFKQIKIFGISLKSTIKDANTITKKIFGLPYYKKTFNGDLSTTYRIPGTRTFHLYKKIKSPHLKKIKLFGIPLKSTRKETNNVAKAFLGFTYYKKETIIKKITPSTIPQYKLDGIMQLWGRFVFPYAIYGASPAMAKLAESFLEICAAPNMHILYISMIMELGHTEKAIELIKEYRARFGDIHFDKKINLAHFAAKNGFSHVKAITQSAEIYERFEQTTHSNFLEKLLKGKSIAVVGNGPSHKGKNLGAEIDAHDIVIRMNNYAIGKEFQKDYGCKTDIWLLGCGGSDVKFRTGPFKAVVFGEDVRYYWGTHSESYRHFILEQKTPCIYIPRECSISLSQYSNIDFPTTGAKFIWLLKQKLGSLRNIDFYGFNFLMENPDTYATHYFQDQSRSERLRRSNGHNFIQEASFLKALISG